MAETCLKLDPYNPSVMGLLENLRGIKKSQAGIDAARKNLQSMENQIRTNPGDVQAAFNLAAAYFQLQQTDRAVQVFNRVLASPTVDPNAVLSVAKVYADIQNLPKLEATLERLVKVSPANPEALV